jgi:hypothetical protein
MIYHQKRSLPKDKATITRPTVRDQACNRHPVPTPEL